MDKAPCRSAGSRRALAPPASGGSSKLALAGSDIDATIPAGRASNAWRCRREGCCRLGSPLPAGLSPLPPVFGLGSRPRFVARRRPGSSAVGLWFGLMSVPSVGGDWPGLALAGRPVFLVATRKMDKKRPAAAPARASALAPPTAGGSRRNSPSRAPDIEATIPAGTRVAQRCRRKAAAGSASPLPAGCQCRAVNLGSAAGPIRRPAQAGGPVPWSLSCLLVACFRLAVIGRVSPRRVTIFLVATKRWKAPLPQRAGLADALAPTTAGGCVETRPHGLRHRKRQFPPDAPCAPALAEGAAAGSASPLSAGCRTCRQFGRQPANDSSPGAGPSPGRFQVASLVGVPSAGGDWLVSPWRATIFFVATRKMDKENAPAAAPLAPVALASLRPTAEIRPHGLRHRRDNFPPRARSTLQTSQLRHCRRPRGAGSAFAGGRVHPVTIRRPGAGRGPVPWSLACLL